MAARLTALAGWLLAGIALAAPVLADDEEPETPSAASTVLFGSLEAGPTKTLISIGLKRAIGGGLDASGFRLLGKVGGSSERTGETRPRGTTYKTETELLLGYEWRVETNFFALSAGLDTETEQRDDRYSVLARARFGPRIQLDLWATPTEQTMLQASAYITGIDRRSWARLAAGWQIAERLYLGPEVEIYRQYNYDKLRLGLHLTGIRLLGLEWRITGGWQHTSDRAPEAYVTLGALWRR